MNFSNTTLSVPNFDLISSSSSSSASCSSSTQKIEQNPITALLTAITTAAPSLPKELIRLTISYTPDTLETIVDTLFWNLHQQNWNQFRENITIRAIQHHRYLRYLVSIASPNRYNELNNYFDDILCLKANNPTTIEGTILTVFINTFPDFSPNPSYLKDDSQLPFLSLCEIYIALEMYCDSNPQRKRIISILSHLISMKIPHVCTSTLMTALYVNRNYQLCFKKITNSIFSHILAQLTDPSSPRILDATLSDILLVIPQFLLSERVEYRVFMDPIQKWMLHTLPQLVKNENSLNHLTFLQILSLLQMNTKLNQHLPARFNKDLHEIQHSLINTITNVLLKNFIPTAPVDDLALICSTYDALGFYDEVLLKTIEKKLIDKNNQGLQRISIENLLSIFTFYTNMNSTTPEFRKEVQHALTANENEKLHQCTFTQLVNFAYQFMMTTQENLVSLFWVLTELSGRRFDLSNIDQNTIEQLLCIRVVLDSLFTNEAAIKTLKIALKTVCIPNNNISTLDLKKESKQITICFNTVQSYHDKLFQYRIQSRTDGLPTDFFLESYNYILLLAPATEFYWNSPDIPKGPLELRVRLLKTQGHRILLVSQHKCRTIWPADTVPQRLDISQQLDQFKQLLSTIDITIHKTTPDSSQKWLMDEYNL